MNAVEQSSADAVCLRRRALATALCAAAVGAVLGGIMATFASYFPDDPTPEHLAATTPFARAVTSQSVEIIGGVVSIVLLSIGIAIIWLAIKRRITREVAISLAPYGFLLMCVGGAQNLADGLPRLLRGGTFRWVTVIADGIVLLAAMLALVVCLSLEMARGRIGFRCRDKPRS